jgi:GDP-D-mannose 3',5'-epimerase
MSERQKTALVCGAGGFIGSYMVRRLREEGYWVRGVDVKYPEYSISDANEFIRGDLTDQTFAERVVQFKGEAGNFYKFVPFEFVESFDEIYQFAADMGGAGYIFSGEHDADVMNNSARINLNILDSVHRLNDAVGQNKTKIFYSSSACIYPEENQVDANNPNCEESSAYPANPDSEYGWEKLFSERLYSSYNRNYGIPIRIARYHNIYGPLGTWQGGKEKAPAAICRKVITSDKDIEIWGDGKQTRSFLYIDDCIDATRLLMQSEFMGPVNIGSEEMVSINELVDIACFFEEKVLEKKYIKGPQGVRGRNSDNRLIEEKLKWKPKYNLEAGLKNTYNWIKEQVNNYEHIKTRIH